MLRSRASGVDIDAVVFLVFAVKVMTRKRKSDELGGDLPVSQMKRKRVSFGGSLCPELFDKRLPPNSPLQKGAAPRRSLSVSQQRQSLLRRASATGPPQVTWRREAGDSTSARHL